jgi:diadenylate cyclase
MAEIGSLKWIAEVAVLSAIIYVALRFLRETRGSGVIRGLALLLGGSILAFSLLIQVLKLEHLAQAFNAVAQSVVLALVIVFHPEIRRAIVHLGDSPIFGRLFPKESKIVQRVLRSVARMSKERIGALIAVERDVSLQSLAESGITIDAELNSFLIESIFFPKSALHDGAIVVRDDRIVAASCLLPLSQSTEVDKRLGTRHRAALGLAEETDALAIVVSEETGKVSAALGGKLSFDLSLEQLERQMEESLGNRLSSMRTSKARASIWAAFTADPLRKLAAALLGLGLYYVLDKQISEDWPIDMTLREITPGQNTASNFVHDSQLLIPLPKDRVELRGFVDPVNGNDITKVTLIVNGPRYALESLHRETLELLVNLPGDWEHGSIQFTAADLQRTMVLAQPGVTVTMVPSRVRVDVIQVASVDRQMHIDLVELQADERLRGRLRPETAEFSPATVRVVGPKQSLQSFPNKTEKPFCAELKAREGDYRVSANVVLQQVYSDSGLRLAEPVAVTMQLMPVMQEFPFELPIRVDDLSLPEELRGRYQPTVKTRTVRIKAGGALQSRLIGQGSQAPAWARENLRLSVWLLPRGDGTQYPDEFTREAQLELLPTLRDQVNPLEFGLAETVSVTLRRQNP